MLTSIRFLVVVAVLGTACGDPEKITNPGTPADPAIPSAPQGFVSAQIDAVAFSGSPLAPSTIQNGRFGFGLAVPELGGLIFSVAMPAQTGRWDVGMSNSPSAAVISGMGDEAVRWIASFAGGSGHVTVTSVWDDHALGSFEFELVPDTAAARAGIARTRMVSSGTFSIAIRR